MYIKLKHHFPLQKQSHFLILNWKNKIKFFHDKYQSCFHIKGKHVAILIGGVHYSRVALIFIGISRCLGRKKEAIAPFSKQGRNLFHATTHIRTESTQPSSKRGESFDPKCNIFKKKSIKYKIQKKIQNPHW